MKVAICDDEIIFVKKIQSIVKSFFANEGTQAEIKTFLCGEDLIECDDVFDIVFLDIEMGQLNGIETAKQLNEKSKHTKIFFFTSHNQYLDDAMDLNVFRYIDKDSSEERIVLGLKKAVESLQVNNIFITTKDNERLLVPVSDIVYVEVKYKKVYVQTDTKQYTVREKMEYFKNILNSTHFAVPHISFIINLEYVTKFKREFVELQGKYTVNVAPKRQAEIRKQWFNYLGE